MPKITALTPDATLNEDDLLVVVDMSGVPTTEKVTVEDAREAFLQPVMPTAEGVAGFDDFTEGVGLAWIVTAQGNGSASILANGAPFGFPGSGVLTLSCGTVSGTDKIEMGRWMTGLVFDAGAPIVYQARINSLFSGIPDDTEYQWIVGLCDQATLSGTPTNIIALVAAWDDGTSTRTHNLALFQSGVPTLVPVTMPALGGGTSWRIRITATTTDVTLEAAVDEGAYSVIGTIASAPVAETYHPYFSANPENGAGDRALVVDWIRWKAARYSDNSGAPIQGIDQFNPGNVQGPGSATNDAIARFDGTTGKSIRSSGVTIDNSANVAGVNGLSASSVTAAGGISASSANISGNIAVSGTVDGRDVFNDGAKLDGIEPGADVTDATNVAAAGALMTSPFNIGYSGEMFTDGLGSFSVRRNTVVAGTPTAFSDSGSGYTQGSLWIDTLTGFAYLCTDASVGAAVWVQIGGNTIASGNYIPVFTPSEPGTTTCTILDSFIWKQTGPVVDIFGAVEIDSTGVTPFPYQHIDFTLPVPCGASSIYFLAGGYTAAYGGAGGAADLRGPIQGVAAAAPNALGRISFLADSAGLKTVTLWAQYRTNS